MSKLLSLRVWYTMVMLMIFVSMQDCHMFLRKVVSSVSSTKVEVVIRSYDSANHVNTPGHHMIKVVLNCSDDRVSYLTLCTLASGHLPLLPRQYSVSMVQFGALLTLVASPHALIQ